MKAQDRFQKAEHMGGPGSEPLIKGEVIDLLARAELKGMKEDLHSLSGRVDSGFTLLSQKFDQLREPKSGLIVSIVSLGVIVLGLIGGFAYWPIRESQNDLKETIRLLSQGVIYKPRYEDSQAFVAKLIEKLDREKATRETQDAVNLDQNRRMDGLASRIREIERKFEIRQMGGSSTN